MAAPCDRLLSAHRSFTLAHRSTPLPQVLTQPATADADEQLVSVRDTLLTLPEEVIQDVGLEVGAGADAGGAHKPASLAMFGNRMGCRHAVSLGHEPGLGT